MESQEQAFLNIRGLFFSYPGRPDRVLKGIDLTVSPGEAVLLTGPTGCGKSTLLKSLNGIVPLESSGRMEGSVLFQGKDTTEYSLPELAQKVGLVFQSPDDQLFCTSVFDEVAFGPQNLGLSWSDVKARVTGSLRQVGLDKELGGQSARLSGGQKQRLAIACQLAMSPLLLALDEPISQLDPKGASDVISVLKELTQKGMAVVLVEHRLTEALRFATRVILMDKGELVLDCPAHELKAHVPQLRSLGLKVPDQILYEEFRARPCTRNLANSKPSKPTKQTHWRAHGSQSGSVPLIGLDKVTFQYPRSSNPALQDISLDIFPGRILAIMGSNGSGKSTLLGILSGLIKPTSGRLLVNGSPTGRESHRQKNPKTALMFQNPDLLLIENHLENQLSAPRDKRKPKGGEQTEAHALAKRLGLEKWLDSPPWALSKGQRLRAAFGSLLAIRPSILLLDEPTTGQNHQNVHRLLDEVINHLGLAAVVICSHDLETVSRFADQVAVLEEGRLADLGAVDEVLPRLARQPDFCPSPPIALDISQEIGLVPPAVTMDALMEAICQDMEGAS